MTELTDADCDVLVDAAAMKIALSLDELDELGPPGPEPSPPVRWIGLSAMAGIDWGTLPGIGPVFVGTVALVRWPRLRIEAGGIGWSRRDFWLAGDPSLLDGPVVGLGARLVVP